MAKITSIPYCVYCILIVLVQVLLHRSQADFESSEVSHPFGGPASNRNPDMVLEDEVETLAMGILVFVVKSKKAKKAYFRS